MRRQIRMSQNVPLAGRVIMFVFGAVFFCVGLTVIGFLWTQPFGEFGSPPLFFRLVGSFIALAFVAMGGGTCWMAVASRHRGTSDFSVEIKDNRERDGAMPPAAGSQTSYVCPRCGAPLAENADVSPHGDVKCTYCDAWFNIHRT
jgi:hypothetical protein